MANLKNFLNPNIKPNVKLDLYYARNIIVGETIPEVVENLHLKTTGKINIAGIIRIDNATVEIIMDHEGPSGYCTLIFNGVRLNNVSYRKDGNTLRIEPKDHDLSEVLLERGDREWSWFGVKYKDIFTWVGTWPAGKTMSQQDMETASEKLEHTAA